MANLTKNIGTVTLSGTVEKVTLPAGYGWVWVKNMSEGDIFAGLSEDISEGADGVMTIPAGECGRIQADSSREIYLMGTGNVQIIGQSYADCPFKSAAKGGGSGGSEIVLLKQEETAYSSSSEYYFTIGDDFNAADYKMFILIMSGKGSTAFTPQFASKFCGEESNIYQVNWAHTDLFAIKNLSGSVLSYFGYQLFGVKA